MIINFIHVVLMFDSGVIFDSGGGGRGGDIVTRKEKSNKTNTSGGQMFEVFTNQIMKLN